MTEPASDRFRLHALGTPDLRAPDGRRVTSVLSQSKRLGLLTYLALADSPVSRAAVVATFWPESDEARARNALSQALFHLRRSLGDDVVQGSEGDRIWASPDRLWCDARELLTDDQPGSAVVAASGRDLLEGWNADDSQPLQEWLDSHRKRIRERGARFALQTEDEVVEPPRAVLQDYQTRRVRRFSVREVALRALSILGPRPASHDLPVVVFAVAMMAFGVIGTLGVVVVGAALAASRIGEPSVPEMAVLLPRVASAPGVAAVNAQAVLDEILADLPSHAELRVVPIQSATSVSELRRQLAATGTPVENGPDWVLEVSIRVSSAEVRVVGLLFRSPSFDLPGRESFDIPYVGAESAFVEVPRKIARGVADMIEDALARDAPGY